ncbi:uncharacterized protein EDB91DRAFT_1294007 [Suillus paluster]|uniref:uncharacterized protein n=1 Tax=Suillus paluster TaxID=48578 RepID=UPI001B885586|nr:uncharacterized protein EDB91DRAFT_1294007 [Suillus paluster]KAG1752749.1 hypothetical protein EDB91DRAFT_1294007 [Suillus paluster]
MSLSNVECLVLAQAVYEYGANAWQQVSKLLSKHPLISRPKNFFSTNSCRDIYARLMNEAQLECPESDANTPHALVNLKLAQKFYSARLLELRDLIAAEEVKFKTIVAEIQDIRAGKWDDKIRAQLSGTEIEPESELDSAQIETVVGEPEVSHDSQEQERENTPQPEEEETAPVQEPESTEPKSVLEPVPVETELLHSPQTQEYEPENDEYLVEVEEPSASTHEEEEEQNEWEQPTSPDDEASEIEAILTPAAPEGSIEEEVETSEQSPKHEDESPVHEEESLVHEEESPMHEEESPMREEETLEREEEEESPARDTEPSHAEPPQETSMNVDAEEQDLSVDTETGSQGKRKVDEVEVGEGAEEPERKRLREESSPPTPGEEEQTTTRPRRDTTSSDQRPSTPLQSNLSGSIAQSTTQAQLPNKRFQSVITLLHSQISQHRNGNIFHNPIKPSEAPDYHDIIKRPMDLKTIKARIKDGVIRTSRDFQRDVYLMFANAMMYNRPGSDIALMAEEMMLESEGHINTFRQTEGYLRNARA